MSISIEEQETHVNFTRNDRSTFSVFTDDVKVRKLLRELRFKEAREGNFELRLDQVLEFLELIPALDE